MERTGTTELFSEEMPLAAEAAVLFAAGRACAAIDLLRMQLGRIKGDIKPWHVLLDIYRIEDKRAAYQALNERYRKTFEQDAPYIQEYSGAQLVVPGMARLGGTISSTADLAQLMSLAGNCVMVAVDMSGVDRIDFQFACTMCALLRGYAHRGKRVILANISDVHAELLEAVGGIAKIVLLRRRAASHERLAMLHAA